MQEVLRINVLKYNPNPILTIGSYVFSYVTTQPWIPILLHVLHLANALHDRANFISTCQYLSKFTSSELEQGDEFLIKSQENYSYGMPLTEIFSATGMIYNAMQYLSKEQISSFNSLIDSIINKCGIDNQVRFDYINKFQYAVMGILCTLGVLSTFFGNDTAAMVIEYNKVPKDLSLVEKQPPIVVEIHNYYPSNEEEIFNTSEFNTSEIQPIDNINLEL